MTATRIPFILDAAQARRLLDAAAALSDASRAPHRGATYRTIFALCYGLGLRGGEACALRVGDIDRGRELLVLKGGKFGKSRLVPHGPRIGELIDEQLERRTEDGRLDDQAPLFTGVSQGLCKAGANGASCLQHNRRSHSSELALIRTALAASRQASRQRPL